MTPPTGTAAPPEGAVLGQHYRLVKRLGNDVLAEHYLGEDRSDGASLLVLVLRGETPPDPARVRAFEEQALQLTGVRRGGEVLLQEVGEDARYGWFAALSLPAGATPADVLRHAQPARTEAPPPPGEAARRSPLDPDAVHRASTSDPGSPPELDAPLELEDLAPPAADLRKPAQTPLYARPGRPRKITPVGLGKTPVRRDPTDPTVHYHPTRSWRLPKRLLLAVLTLAALAVGAWALWSWWSPRGSRQTGDSTRSGGSPPRKAPRREVRLRFVVEPESARMYVRNRPVHGRLLLVPYSDKPLQVEFRAPGHRRERVRVVPNRSRRVLVVLKKR